MDVVGRSGISATAPPTSILPDLSAKPELEPDISELTQLSGGRIQVSPFDPARSRERTRTWAVVGLGAIYAVESAFLLGSWADGRSIADLKELVTLLVTPTVTLLGTALGFYFSSRT